MHPIDWTILALYLAWLIRDGLKRSHATNEIDGYLLAKRSLPWWAAGLSVMATQLSAITLVGTTGLGYADGMRFVQFYFGLPIAMVILSLTVVPFFYRARVYTAYEYLERRFDAKVRALATLLFLAGRSMSSGVVIAAPAVILSVVLGWNLTLTVLAIGIPTAVYTMFGGVQAVAWTDVKQMAVIVSGVLAAVAALVLGLPGDVSVGESLHLAGAVGRLKTLDFSFSLTERYTVWSGTIASLFLMLSYFGCDQSQVQRYLTAKSVDEGRRSLLMSAYFKIPLQALILLTGVLVFAFYVFNRPPMLFNPVHRDEVESSARAAEYSALEGRFASAFERRLDAARDYSASSKAGDESSATSARAAFAAANAEIDATRRQAATLVREVTGNPLYEDVNYVFPTFVTTQMPVGLIGLIIAAIFAAAMSSAAGEMNSLATVTVIDVYRRHLKTEASEGHYLAVSKAATGFWGLAGCAFALYAARAGSLIEVVNMVGSLFYGTLLGAFALAIGSRRANGTGTFVGMLAGFATVLAAAAFSSISYLWYNVVGFLVVVVIGLAVSSVGKR
jgi:Na+/proline symporter